MSGIFSYLSKQGDETQLQHFFFTLLETGRTKLGSCVVISIGLLSIVAEVFTHVTQTSPCQKLEHIPFVAASSR